jgi:Tfp pilus assembly protein PilO
MGLKQSAFTMKLMIIIAAGVLVLAIGLFSWHRQNVRLNDLQRSIKDMNREMAAITVQTQERKRYQEDKVTLTRKLASIDTQLKDYRYTPSYLEQLQDIAAKSGNIITRIKPDDLRPIDLQHSPLSAATSDGPEKVTKKKVAKKPTKKKVAKAGAEPEKDQYRVQQIDLEVHGTYVSVLRLIDRLRAFPKLVYVRRVAMTPRKGQDELPGSVAAKLDTYVIITPNQYESTDAKRPTGARKPAPARGGAR